MKQWVPGGVRSVILNLPVDGHFDFGRAPASLDVGAAPDLVSDGGGGNGHGVVVVSLRDCVD